MKLYSEEIPLQQASEPILLQLMERPYAVWLDSSEMSAEQPSYSFFVVDPLRTCQSFTDWRSWVERLPHEPQVTRASLPFCGGWVGYLSYEAYEHFLPEVPPRTTQFPSVAFAFYDSFVLIDHQQGRCHVASLGLADVTGPQDEALAREKIARLKRDLLEAADKMPPSTAGIRKDSDATSNLSRAEYRKKFAAIQDYLRSGDCYQINLTQCFSAETQESATAIYRRLRTLSPVSYGAFLNWGDFQVLSASPECFLKLQDGRIRTEPIKGTRPRGADNASDAQAAQELLDSDKDRAELLMITDLERNDLGRICKAGTVTTRTLRRLSSYAQVHHLSSVVEGALRDDMGLHDILQACFPGGSITGAPKIRAMQIIRDLEPHAREMYTGAIGFVGLDGSVHFNVAIRTMIYRAGEVKFYAGGGIVVDSDADAEYEECLVKASAMREALHVQ